MKPASPASLPPRRAWLEAGGVAAVAGLAVALRLPAPGPDDLFYSGAAFSLAEHGTLRNPLLDGQRFPGADFLIYPPFYQYLLAGWLRVTGIGTLALVAFQQFWFALAGFTFCRLLQQHGVLARSSVGWAALFTLGFNGSLGAAGMRPDVCAFALLFSGFALRGQTHPAAKLAAWTLIFCSLGVTPNVLPYLVLGLGLMALLGSDRSARLRREGWFLLAGGVISFGLFLVSIGGRLVLFVHGFLHHATRAVLPPAQALLRGTDHFWHAARQQPHYWLGLALAAVVAAVAFAGPSDQRLKRLRWPLALTGLVLLTLFASVTMTWIRAELRLFTVTAWSLATCAWLAGRQHTRWLSLGALAVWAVCLGWQLAPRTARLHAGALCSPAELAAIRRSVEDGPRYRWLVDSWSAREVFDYRLPAGARDWHFSEPFPALWPCSLAQLAPGDAWIISGLTRRLLVTPAPQPALRTAFSLGPLAVKYYADDFRVLLITPAALLPGQHDS